MLKLLEFMGMHYGMCLYLIALALLLAALRPSERERDAVKGGKRG